MRSPQDDDRSSLVESWASNASAWVEWTRQGHDSYRWHKTSFLPLIPPAGRLTVDVGAGEGRVSRELQAVGHRVLAIDSSFTMTQAAATHPQTRVPAVVADAAGLPLTDASADCAVAFMSLHDIDDLEGTLAEIGRVLALGGTLVMAIVHPLNSAGAFAPDSGTRLPRYVIEDSYTDTRRYTDTRVREGMTMTYHGIHRPLQAYTDALSAAGLTIRELRERAAEERGDKWSRVPLFLHIVAARS